MSNNVFFKLLTVFRKCFCCFIEMEFLTVLFLNYVLNKNIVMFLVEKNRRIVGITEIPFLSTGYSAETHVVLENESFS